MEILRKGTIVKCIMTGELAVLMKDQSRHGAISGFSHGGPNWLRASHEVVVYGHIDNMEFLPHCLYFPYGVALQDNGDQVLFNRFYHPIWRRNNDGQVFAMKPDEKFSLEKKEYVGGENVPYSFREHGQQSEEILKSWGVSDYPIILTKFLEYMSEETKIEFNL